MIDNYRHKGLRKQLVQEIETKGIKNDDVLAAIGKIPRHFFLDNAFVEFAYSNKAFPIGAGQTISHPYTVAFQSELLQVKKGDKILEIGTGSGYQTTVLCELGAKVFKVSGLLALVGVFFPAWGFLLFLLPILAGSIYVVIYSYVLYRRYHPSNNH